MNEEEKKNDAPKKRSLFSRVVALFSVVLIVCLVIWLVWAMVTGSEHILQILFICIIVPIIFYLLVWLKKTFSN